MKQILDIRNYKYFILSYLLPLTFGLRYDEWPVVFALPLILLTGYHIMNTKYEVLGYLTNSKILTYIFLVQIIGWILAFGCYFLSFKFGFDLLSYCQGIAHYAIDGNYYNQSLNIKALCDHFTPFLLVFTPLFALSQTALWILAAKLVCYFLSIIPLFKISEYFKLTTLQKNGVIIMYLVFYPSSIFLTYDFHPSNFAILFIPLAFYLYLVNYQVLFYLVMITMLTLKEQFGIVWISFGVYIFFFEKKYAKAVVFVLLGVIFSLLIFYKITPFLAGCENFHKENYFAPFANIPKKFEFIFNLIIGVGFLVVIDWRVLLFFLSSCALTFVSGQETMATIGFHYHDVPTAFLFLGAILVFKEFNLHKYGFINHFKFKNYYFLIFVVSMLFYNKQFATRYVKDNIPTKEHLDFYSTCKLASSTLDKTKKLWVQNVLGIYFLNFKNLNSIQGLRSITHTNEIIYKNSEVGQYIVLSDLVSKWPFDSEYEQLKNDLDTETLKGNYIKINKFENLLVYQKVK
ncbi:MAG: DUF2079 domain-containing protein [Cytophagales bacterium]